MSDSLVVKHAEDVMRAVHGSLPEVAGSTSSPINSSWKRCVNQYNLDPSKLYAPTVIDAQSLQDLQEQHEDLIEIARAEMDSLHDQISGSGYGLMLTDANGIILCERTDPSVKQMFRGAGLMVGADWSESREGTNGIGTCLSEQRPVTIYRADHFRARHIGLSCSGAPIRDAHGQVIAVLDASGVDARDTRASQMHTIALVNMSAQLIEKCFFLRRHQNHRVLRFHHRPELVNLLHDGALALSEDGVIVAADATASKLLGASHRLELAGRSIFEIFDSGLNELTFAAATLRNALWQLRDLRHGRRFYASLTGAATSTEPLPTSPMPSREIKTIVQVAPHQPPARCLTLEEVAGNDPQMLRNVRSARRIATSNVSVLIRGPTGSGKEAFAKALHQASHRADKPFVAVNCAAIPESLIESELFGYKAGAFTGARKEGMRGRVLQSSGGTLFLDEIGDMPLLLQTRLLRVLEECEVVPLGSETPVQVDLRVISASHRNLREMIEQGTFREDLYYRLNGITLELPALAEREDKDRLIRQMIASETRDGRPIAIEVEAFERLLHYPWPGNIRELRNVVRTALAICDGGLITLADLPREVRSPVIYATPARPEGTMPSNVSSSLHRVETRSLDQRYPETHSHDAAPHTTVPPVALPRSATPMPGENPLEAAERTALIQAIEHNRWNMSHTAAQLGMSRNTLYRKIKRHRIPLGRDA